MNISSNTLFHFTDKLTILKKIISEGFKMSYCLEFENAFPMISFCDLPISRIAEQKYGNYGLGMSIDWGYENKLNPVSYFQEDSGLIESFRNANLAAQQHMIDIIQNKKSQNFISEIKPYIQYILESSRYHKHYAADLERDNIVFTEHKFYDEREWRYVPKINSDNIKHRMSKDEYLVYKKDHVKPHFNHNPLKFKATDIRYIILNSTSEISEFIEFLNSQHHLSENSNEIDILKTKITTMEMMKQDN